MSEQRITGTVRLPASLVFEQIRKNYHMNNENDRKFVFGPPRVLNGGSADEVYVWDYAGFVGDDHPSGWETKHAAQAAWGSYDPIPASDVQTPKMQALEVPLERQSRDCYGTVSYNVGIHSGRWGFTVRDDMEEPGTIAIDTWSGEGNERIRDGTVRLVGLNDHTFEMLIKALVATYENQKLSQP